jgi:predicted nucleic acid-binding protein
MAADDEMTIDERRKYLKRMATRCLAADREGRGELLNEADAALEQYADIRRKLRPPQGPGLIGDTDTLIAATALERATEPTDSSTLMREERRG